MPKQITEYRCLLISPSDVDEEREALQTVVNNWNAHVGKMLRVRVELVRWETHSSPDLAGIPQEVLNSQIVDDCDLGIAIFWSRVGTPTRQHQSGSLEEIRRLLDQGRRVMGYLKNDPIPKERIDTVQLDRLKEIESDLKGRGILWTFNGTGELREKVQLHLTSAVAALLESKQLPHTGSTNIPSVISKPDVRVCVKTGLTFDERKRTRKIIGIKVENHSPSTVYLGSISFRLDDGRSLQVPRDSVTGLFQSRRQLNSGESFTFNLSGETLRKASIGPTAFDRVILVDDIGRMYESDRTELRAAIEEVLRE